MSKIVAHRGASAQAPENTLAAFELAITLGADFLEFDVCITADREYIVIHDSHANLKILAGQTYSQILKTPGHEAIPTLKQVLELAAGRVSMYVEFKFTGYEKEVVDMVLEYCSIEDFAIISFKDQVIVNVKNYMPDIRCGLLLVEMINGKMVCGFRDYFPLARVKACGADFVAPRYIGRLTGVIFLACAFKVPLYVWTINDPQTYRWIGRLKNIESIASDLPSDMTPAALQLSDKRKFARAAPFRAFRIRY